MSSLLLHTRFTPHEFTESVLPSVQAESTEASHDAAITAIDVAHALAFRKGLGSSLFASPHGPELSHEDAKAFASSAFTKGSVSVFGTGIDPSALAKLVEKNLGSLPTSSGITAHKTAYFGGESRVSLESHGPQTIFIGYGASSAATPELSVLAAHLSSSPHVKWSEGSASTFSSLPREAKVQTVLLPYSDATLFGLLIQAPTTEAVHAAGKSVVSSLKSASSSIKAEDLKKAIAKAKFNAASPLDNRQGLLDAVALQVLTGSSATVESIFSGLDGVSASAASGVS